MKKFYQITQTERTADIDIYGDITSTPYDWWTGEQDGMSAKLFREELESLDVDHINVYINSYGGEVAEALAIYSTLKRHNATVHTYCDGFACSAATIIFAAGDQRTMGSIALLMIHNCMSYIGYANSNELRKAAEDNDKINQSSIEAYKAIVNIPEEQIKGLMDNETWLTAQECIEYGFATDIAEAEENTAVTQSAYMSVRDAVLGGLKPEGPDQFEMVMNKLEEVIERLSQAPEQKVEGDPVNLGTPEQTEKEKVNSKAVKFFGSLI